MNAGIIAAIEYTPGTFGYVDYGFPCLVKLDVASLQNNDCKFIAPGLEGGSPL